MRGDSYVLHGAAGCGYPGIAGANFESFVVLKVLMKIPFVRVEQFGGLFLLCLTS